MIRKRPIFLLCLIFSAVIWMMNALGVASVQEPSRNDEILQYIEAHPKVVRIYGQIYRRVSDGTALYLTNSYLQTQSDIISLENVKVYMNEENRLPVGAGVLVVGKLQKIPRASNPGQFDSELYYKTQHIYYRMVDATVTVEKKPVYSLRETLAGIRDRLYQSLEDTAEDYAPLYQAMLLGDKSQLEDETRDRYQMAGMLHILAISGMHLSLLGMGCYELLNRMGASTALSGILSVFLLFSYGILTGEGVATMRALCMFVLVMGARLMGRSYDLLSAMALAALFLLIDSPYYLYYSGFQLSFGCILGIGVIYPRLREFAPERNSKNYKFQRYFLDALLGSLSIQMATLPITLYHFYEYPVYGILLNLAAIPAVSVVLVTGIFCSGAGILSIPLGRAIAFPGCMILKGYDLLGMLAQNMPMTMWVTGQPRIWQIIMYYAGLWIAMSIARWGITEKKRCQVGLSVTVSMKKLVRSYIIISAGTVLIIIFIVLLVWRPSGELIITNLDIGQGDCCVVRTPGGVSHLIDGGSSNVSEVGRYRILPYLKNQGISRVDYAWVSHTDADHVSGIEEILTLQAQKRSSVVIVNLMLPDWGERGKEYVQMEGLAKKAGVVVHHMLEGDGLQEPGLSWTVLAPAEGEGADANESSQVLLLESGEFQGLFTGDIGESTERKLSVQLPDVDYLKVAHHGSKNSSCREFLAKARPEIAVISCSATNRYGHPSPEAVERLEEAGSSIWYTMDSGAVTLEVKEDQVYIKTFISSGTPEGMARVW